MGWIGPPTKTYFAVSLWKDWKGTDNFVSGVNLQDPMDKFFNAREEVSRNYLKQNRKVRITKIQNLELLLSSYFHFNSRNDWQCHQWLF